MQQEKLIERRQYMQQLRNLKDQNIIKVISGVRRCGKINIINDVCQRTCSKWCRRKTNTIL
jgi:predicted AAA+ superfamily ATPase